MLGLLPSPVRAGSGSAGQWLRWATLSAREALPGGGVRLCRQRSTGSRVRAAWAHGRHIPRFRPTAETVWEVVGRSARTCRPASGTPSVFRWAAGQPSGAGNWSMTGP